MIVKKTMTHEFRLTSGDLSKLLGIDTSECCINVFAEVSYLEEEPVDIKKTPKYSFVCRTDQTLL